MRHNSAILVEGIQSYRRPLNLLWRQMRSRCRSKTHAQYAYYGGRGIKVCERWNVFATFVEDIGPRPSSRHSIERIDNDGNYEPSNCRWATQKEQARNRRDNTIVTYGGERMALARAAELAGFSYQAVVQRIVRGWSIDAALSIKPRKIFLKVSRRQPKVLV